MNFFRKYILVYCALFNLISLNLQASTITPVTRETPNGYKVRRIKLSPVQDTIMESIENNTGSYLEQCNIEKTPVIIKIMCNTLYMGLGSRDASFIKIGIYSNKKLIGDSYFPIEERESLSIRFSENYSPILSTFWETDLQEQ